MVVFDNFREILGLMVLIAGFVIALWILPNPADHPVPVQNPNGIPVAIPSAGVEKISVPIHTIFAS